MTGLRREHCELNYEGLFARPQFRLMDSPGRLFDVLLGALQGFECTSADLSHQDGEPNERRVGCEIDRLDSSVTIRGDRMEIHCADYSTGLLGDVATVMGGIWSGLAETTPGIAWRTHSFSFEVDADIASVSYRELLRRLAPAPNSLPAGTETAVVYYLPAEKEWGHLESSLFFNRSDAVERGIQINATLVFEGRTVTASELIQAAQARFDHLLEEFGMGWVGD